MASIEKIEDSPEPTMKDSQMTFKPSQELLGTKNPVPRATVGENIESYRQAKILEAVGVYQFLWFDNLIWTFFFAKWKAELQSALPGIFNRDAQVWQNFSHSAKLEKNRARIPDHSICATFCYGINVRLLSVCIDYWESTSVSNAEEGADLKLLLFRMAGKATTDLPLRPHIDSASRP